MLQKKKNIYIYIYRSYLKFGCDFDLTSIVPIVKTL